MRTITVAFVLFLLKCTAASAQWTPTNPENPSLLDLSVGYNYVRANAPPGGCPCFSLQGGYLSADVRLTNWLGVDAAFTGQHGNDISVYGQNLTLLTFAAGPRVHKNFGRLQPFAQVLVGGAHGSDSYFPTGTTSSPSATSFALQTGGGLNYLLSHRFAIQVFNVQYLMTQLPNAANNEQNQLMAAAGIIFRFNHPGSGGGKTTVAPPPPPTDQLELSCTSNVNSIDQGDTLEIVAKTLTEPPNLQATYTWTTSVGTIVGSGDRVALDTQGIPPGGYEIIGHATAKGSKLLSADCEIPFRIKTRAETIVAPTPMPPAKVDPEQDKEFHENVPDALFNFDSAEIRPDAQLAIDHAAEYLKAHPSIGVLIGGFADDRGSAEYNLALGEERAEAARKALIAAGVDPVRLQIISYGKEVQVCTTENEACRQQNRRAAFSMHP